MHALVVAGSAVLGLVVGSVLNVLIDRVPHKVPLSGPREGEVVPPQSWLGIPAQPWVMGITIRAAKSGPDGKNPTDSIGKGPHEIA